MDRRVFLSTLGGGLLAAPLAAEAQQSGKVPRIGILGNGRSASSAEWKAFRQVLRELGWIEGQTVAVVYRDAEGNPDRFHTLAAELVQLKVDVILVTGPPAIHAAQEATDTIPIVFVALADPVALGYVTSLSRPAGHLTGLASQYEELITKQMQLSKEAVPTLSRIAESAFKTARIERVEAIHALPSPIFYAHRKRLVELAARYRLPGVYELKPFVEDGGLMSYGSNIVEMFRGMASYVDRILKGAKPGDLPKRPTKFDLVINLRTAKTLGLTIPLSLLQRADQVIE